MKGAKIEREIIRVFIISVPIIVETHIFSDFRLGSTEKICQTSLLKGLCLALLLLMHLESCNFLSWTRIIMTRTPTKKIMHTTTSRKVFTGSLHGLILIIQVRCWCRSFISLASWLSNRKKEANITNKNGLCFPAFISFHLFASVFFQLQLGEFLHCISNIMSS